ncbi:CCR4-NOT transcription complex subunit 2 [Histomonas meleagridis]|uniref:CCR4-NOT transcription complex subunit 2 n=1 Tax=Histomonas meleagridis TaxID=135588 RepID=UPI003559AB06|nr:CCR4-NOT transcription complex subunit 2 [Histomonas meleagridis]KAH0803374.1 CCR4-NOT transcription complex subunit 2 [Histomonas meleagridis]
MSRREPGQYYSPNQNQRQAPYRQGVNVTYNQVYQKDIPQNMPQPSQISFNPTMRKTSATMINSSPSEIPPSFENNTPISINPLFTPCSNPELDEEFDFVNLGIDLNAREPLLPRIYYAGSDAPMVHCSQFPVPDSYPRQLEEVKALDRLRAFSDEALFFVFYLHAKDELQLAAYNELLQRGFIFDKENKYWKNQIGFAFDCNQWKFVQPNESHKIPIVQQSI